LKTCPRRRIFFKRNEKKMEVYIDANYAGFVTNRRSISTYCMFLGGNLVTLKSKKQNVVARSSAKVEYQAMTDREGV